MFTSTYNRIVKITVWTIIKLTEVFIRLPLASIAYFTNPQKLPKIKNDILLQSATQLAKKIRDKEIKSVEIIEAYIQRINEINPIINAVVEERFREAIDEAIKVDNLIANQEIDEVAEKYPLLGVPITVKGSIAVKGLSNAAGRYFEESERKIAKRDADVIKQVKNAGGIIMLVSNTPEMCFNFETFNNVIGRTLNPYDTRKTCGGSSGGEASLLGSGSSLVGIGSDISGSLRLPAFYCGVFGHKPTANVVSTVGHYPDCTDKEAWANFFTLGPMVRYADDLLLVLKVITKPEKHALLRLNEKVDVSRLKIYYMLNDGGSILTHTINKEIVHTMQNALDHLENKIGCDVTKVNLSELKNSVQISYMSLLKVNGVEHCLIDDEKSAILESMKLPFGCTKHTAGAVLYLLIKRAVDNFVTQEQFDLIEEERIILKNKMEEMLGEDGVFIYPTFPETAGYHNYCYSNAFDAGYLAIFNALGFPVTNCPINIGTNGMPIGIQIIAGPNGDRLTIAVAKELENIFGGWISP